MSQVTASDMLSDAMQEAAPIIHQRYSRSLECIRHRFDCDDLVQVVSLRAYKAFAKCQGRTQLEIRNWILKIAANAARTAIATHRTSIKRSTKLESVSIATAGDEPYFEPVDTRVSAATAAIREQCDHMLACIDRLPKQRQRVLYMRFLEQKSYADIASELNITLQAARTSVCQAVQQARQEMPQYSLPGFE